MVLRGFDHLAHIKPTRIILNAIIRLHSDVQQYPLEWKTMCKAATDLYPHHCLPSLEHDLVLYILIRYAPESLLRLFLGRAPVRVKTGTNPLIYAVTGKVEHARILLSHGAKLDLCGMFVRAYENGCISGLPIEAAIRGGDRKLVDLFFAEGSPVPHRLFSVTLLGEACFPIPTYVMARLLQADEFVEWAKNIEHKSPLLRILDHRNYDLSNQPMEDDVVVIARRLRQIGCDLSGDNSFIQTLIRQAAYAGHISTIEYFLSEFEVSLPPDMLLDASRNGGSNEAMIRFLIHNGADVYIISTDKNTALHHAMQDYQNEKSCLEKITVLCQVGCDPSTRNMNDRTPMHLAAARGYLHVVKHLLSVGALLPADVLFQALSDRSHTTFIHPDAFRTALPTSVIFLDVPRNDLSMIRFLLAEGADVRAIAANGDTVLHALLRSPFLRDFRDCLESVKVLITAGCDPGIPNSVGETPVVLAVLACQVPVVKYLLSLHIPLPSDILLSRQIYRFPDHDLMGMMKILLDNDADRHVTSPDGRNGLHYLIECLPGPSFRAIQTLANAGCDLFARSSDGETLLHVAARRRRFELIQYLLSRGLPLPSDILLVASYFLNPQQIQFLIDKGADVCAADANGNTPLHRVVHLYSEYRALEFAKILIGAGSDPSAFNSSHKTPMHVAVNRGYMSVIHYLLSLRAPLPPDIILAASASYSDTIAPLVRHLIENGADATIVAENGNTALHLALVRGLGHQDDPLETTKILVGAGCDIHARNSDGETPLISAARGGHIAIVEYLLSLGAPLPVNAFLAAASCRHYSRKIPTLRFFAALEGADIHVVASNGNSALHHAAESEDCLETVKILISMGCDPSLRNSAGKTPLHTCARTGNIPVVKYLLSQGIPLPPDVLLSAAVRNWGMAQMIRFLIREGADPCVANDNGDTPLHVALKKPLSGLKAETSTRSGFGGTAPGMLGGHSDPP